MCVWLLLCAMIWHCCGRPVSSPVLNSTFCLSWTFSSRASKANPCFANTCPIPQTLTHIDFIFIPFSVPLPVIFLFPLMSLDTKTRAEAQMWRDREMEAGRDEERKRQRGSLLIWWKGGIFEDKQMGGNWDSTATQLDHQCLMVYIRTGFHQSGPQGSCKGLSTCISQYT